jgi:hypothetical protein
MYKIAFVFQQLLVNKNGTWSTVFPGELTVPQMVKKYPAFY